MSTSVNKHRKRHSLFMNTAEETKPIICSPELKSRKLFINDKTKGAKFECFTLKNMETEDELSKSFCVDYLPLSIKDKVEHITEMETASVSRFNHYSQIFDQIKEQITEINEKILESPTLKNRRRQSNAIVNANKFINANLPNNQVLIRKVKTNRLKKLRNENEERSNYLDDLDENNDIIDNNRNNDISIRETNFIGGRRPMLPIKKLSECVTKQATFGVMIGGEEQDKLFKMAKEEFRKSKEHYNNNKDKVNNNLEVIEEEELKERSYQNHVVNDSHLKHNDILVQSKVRLVKFQGNEEINSDFDSIKYEMNKTYLNTNMQTEENETGKCVIY